MFKRLKKLLPRKFITRLTICTTPFVRLRYGAPLTIRPNTTDASVFRDIFFYGDLAVKLAQAPKVIIDAGAYVGYSAVYLAKRFPDAQIIAVEPEVSNFAQLQKHTTHLSRITCVQGALWSESTPLKITDRDTGHWGFNVTATKPGETPDVMGFSIGDLLAKINVSSADFVKLDIEGSEYQLFTHNPQSWLSKVNTILVELHERIAPGCTAAVLQALPAADWDQSDKGEKLLFTRKTS